MTIPTETLRRALHAATDIPIADWEPAIRWLWDAERAMNPATSEEDAAAILRAGREQYRKEAKR